MNVLQGHPKARSKKLSGMTAVLFGFFNIFHFFNISFLYIFFNTTTHISKDFIVDVVVQLLWKSVVCVCVCHVCVLCVCCVLHCVFVLCLGLYVEMKK
jgi:hypothetical protein